MMGRLSHYQEQFFYSFRLEEAVLELTKKIASDIAKSRDFTSAANIHAD